MFAADVFALTRHNRQVLEEVVHHACVVGQRFFRLVPGKRAKQVHTRCCSPVFADLFVEVSNLLFVVCLLVQGHLMIDFSLVRWKLQRKIGAESRGVRPPLCQAGPRSWLAAANASC